MRMKMLYQRKVEVCAQRFLAVARFVDERLALPFVAAAAFFLATRRGFFASNSSLGTKNGSANILVASLGRVVDEVVVSILATSTRTARSTGVGCHWMGQ